MYQRSAGGRWLEILLFTTSSLILYHTGVGIILFLVPLQVVASRRGVQGLANNKLNDKVADGDCP